MCELSFVHITCLPSALHTLAVARPPPAPVCCLERAHLRNQGSRAPGQPGPHLPAPPPPMLCLQHLQIGHGLPGIPNPHSPKQTCGLVWA